MKPLKPTPILNGFTLIEVLLVLAIIVLLASLIYAVFAPARERGREALCISHLRQWGVAITMYRADYDGIDPVPGGTYNDLYTLGVPPRNGDGIERLMRDYKLVGAKCPNFTNWPNARPNIYATGYHMLLFGEDDPDPDQLRWIGKLGMNMAVMACLNHNPQPKLELNPTWAQLRALILRLDGHVKMRYIPAYGASSWTW